MKLSIWQQFSSNHSGVFWVVGTFVTVPEAQTAYETLRKMLFSVDHWHREHKEAMQSAYREGKIGLFPPEQEVAEKYQVEWNKSIDWTGWAEYYMEDHPFHPIDDAHRTSERLINDAVSIVGRNVIVRNPDQTWMTTQPFEGIMSRLGAETIGYDLDFIESEASKNFAFTTELRFTAPDASTADRLEREISDYVRNVVSPDYHPPWHEDKANYQLVLDNSPLLYREYIELQINSGYHPSYLFGLTTHALALRDDSLKIERNRFVFRIMDARFNHEVLGMSAMIAWLEVNRCTEIDFRYIRAKLLGSS